MKNQFFRIYFILLYFSIPISLLSQNTVLNLGHFGSIEDIDIDPSGQYLVSIGSKGKVKLWEAENYRLLRDLNQHALYGNEVKFSSDGKFIYSFGGDKMIHKYNTKDGEILKSKRVEYGIGTSFDVSPNGKYLVTNDSKKNELSIIDAKSFELIKSIQGEVPFIYDLSFSSDGKKIACIGNNRRVYIYDTKNWELIFTSEEYANAIELVDFHPDNIHLAINVYQQKIIIVNTLSKKEIFELKWPKKEEDTSYQPIEPINEEKFIYPQKMLFSQDGNFLYGYKYHELFIYNFPKLEGVERLEVEKMITWEDDRNARVNDILSVDFFRNRIYVNCTSSKGYYDLNEKKYVSVEHNPLPISTILFDKKDFSFTMHNEDGKVKKVDLKNGKLLGEQIEVKSKPLYSNLVFSKDKRFIFGSKPNGIRYARMLKDIKKEAYILLPNSKMVSMSEDKGGFSNNSQYFAFASKAGVRFKKLDSDEKFGLIPNKETKCWIFGREGKSIYLSSFADSLIHEYDLETQNLIWEWNTKGKISAIEISPDEKHIAIICKRKASKMFETIIVLISTEDKKVKKEWNIEGGKSLLWLTDTTFINFGGLSKAKFFNIKNEQQVKLGNYFSALITNNYAIDPTGNHFALLNADQKLVVFDLKEGKRVNLDNIKEIQFARSIAFSDDGQFLLITNSDRKAIIFDLLSKNIIANYLFFKGENELVFFAQNEKNQLSTNYKNNLKELIYKVKNNKIYPIPDNKLTIKNIFK